MPDPSNEQFLRDQRDEKRRSRWSLADPDDDEDAGMVPAAPPESDEQTYGDPIATD